MGWLCGCQNARSKLLSTLKWPQCSELRPQALLKRAPTDIAAAKPFRPVDLIDHVIGHGPRLAQACSARRDIQNPPALCGEICANLRGSGMKTGGEELSGKAFTPELTVPFS